MQFSFYHKTAPFLLFILPNILTFYHKLIQEDRQEWANHTGQMSWTITQTRFVTLRSKIPHPPPEPQVVCPVILQVTVLLSVYAHFVVHGFIY